MAGLPSPDLLRWPPADLLGRHEKLPRIFLRRLQTVEERECARLPAPLDEAADGAGDGSWKLHVLQEGNVAIRRHATAVLEDLPAADGTGMKCHEMMQECRWLIAPCVTREIHRPARITCYWLVASYLVFVSTRSPCSS